MTLHPTCCQVHRLYHDTLCHRVQDNFLFGGDRLLIPLLLGAINSNWQASNPPAHTDRQRQGITLSCSHFALLMVVKPRAIVTTRPITRRRRLSVHSAVENVLTTAAHVCRTWWSAARSAARSWSVGWPRQRQTAAR